MRRLPGCLAAAAALAVAVAPAPGAYAAAARLAVPFVEQSPALCGGAAAAMMLRHAGALGVHAEDFSPLVDEAVGGIYADRLVAAMEARGYAVLRPPTPGPALDDVARARAPLLALLSSNTSILHYVVVVGVEDDMIVVHDPAVGPDQRLARDDFMRRWASSGYWGVQVIAPRDPANDHAVAEPVPGIREPSDGETASDARIDSAAARDWYERASSEFRRERWRAAADAARRAVVLDPSHARAWNLLGASRYLAGDADGALKAWNRIDRPRIDLVQAPGERRTRHDVVTSMTGLRSGELLTSKKLRLANRRVDALPGASGGRVSYRIQRDATAAVDVTVVERSNDLTVRGTSALLRAATDREVVVPVTSLFRAGESITASGRFWQNRPRVRLNADIPAPLGKPVVTSLTGGWARQSYRQAGLVTETHRWAGAGLSSWIGPNLLAEGGLGFHRVNDAGYGAVGAAGEYRLAGDAVGLRVSSQLWFDEHDRHAAAAAGIASRHAFDALALRLDLRGGIERVEADAPLAMRGGVGAGHAGTGLLRAHPLVGSDGIIDGAGFAPSVVHASADVTRWLFAPVPLMRVGVATFVDAARMQHADDATVLVDAGLGLRLALPASLGGLGLDFAHGLRDDAFAVSLRWTTAWPRWGYDD